MRRTLAICRGIDDLFPAVNAVAAGEVFRVGCLECLVFHDDSAGLGFEDWDLRKKIRVGGLADGLDDHVDGNGEF